MREASSHSWQLAAKSKKTIEKTSKSRASAIMKEKPNLQTSAFEWRIEF